MLIMDCLCRYRVPLSALRIEQIMNTDPFYVSNGANRIDTRSLTARPDRRSVRILVHRIWKRLGIGFHELGLNLDPRAVLVAQETDLNTMVYRLRSTSEILHIRHG